MRGKTEKGNENEKEKEEERNCCGEMKGKERKELK